MSELAVVYTRGPIVESVHQVSAAVVTTDGRLVGHAGDPGLATFWRSCAKPFALMPLVEDGGIERFHLDQAMLALACASHNAEPVHREIGARWLMAIGVTEADLSCGGHPSLWPALANEMIHDDITATPLWSNCSGNHAALLGLAALHGWPTEGYEQLSHPVHQRVIGTIAKWSGLSPEALQWGVDGCTAAVVALPLSAMARAYAQLGVATEKTAHAIRSAIVHQPYVVAGAERLDTVLMQAWAGRVLTKIGAEGVYSAALPTLGLGIALKVHDGDMVSACLALVAVLEATVARFGATESWPLAELERWRTPPIRNTRDAITGYMEIAGGVTWG
jgi:L-asparaginase II